MPELHEFAAHIGIDWADQKHDVALLAAGASSIEQRRIAHSPEAIAEWIAELRRRFRTARSPSPRDLARCAGPRAPGARILVLVPIDTRALARFREALTPSGAKNDAPDAMLLLELLVKHGERLRAWKPDDEATRALRRLSEHRRKTVDLRTKLTQQLRSALKEYFPQAISWVGDDLGLFGSDRDRFQSAEDVQLLSGIAPVTEQAQPAARASATNYDRS